MVAQDTFNGISTVTVRFIAISEAIFGMLFVPDLLQHISNNMAFPSHFWLFLKVQVKINKGPFLKVFSRLLAHLSRRLTR